MQIGRQIRHERLYRILLRKKCLGHDLKRLYHKLNNIMMIPIRLQRKQHLAQDTHLCQPLPHVEPLVPAGLQERDEVLEVHALDLLPCARPELEVECDGTVADFVHDCGVTRVRFRVFCWLAKGRRGGDALWRAEVQAEELEQCLEAGHIDHRSLSAEDIHQNFVATFREEKEKKISRYIAEVTVAHTYAAVPYPQNSANYCESRP
jgi:hypothetical protein